MRPYEVMVIFDTGAEPPAIQAVVDRLLETIRSSEGTPGAVDRWGRRPFAYEVKHRREGYYVLVDLSGTSRTVDGIDRMLSLADEVLRHKVIRVPEKVTRRDAGSSGGRRRDAGSSGGRSGDAGSSGGRSGDAGSSAGGEGPAGAGGARRVPAGRVAG